jgi:hypothetical protein
MRTMIWIAPVLLWLGGCSKDGPPTTYAAPAVSPGPIVASAAVVEAASPFTPEPPARVPAVISSGTSLHVRVDNTIDTRRNRVGDRFQATLVRPVMVNGRTILPSGTPFHGHVTTAAASGRLKGRAVLGLTLDGFRLRGREYRIDTTHVSRVSNAHKRRNTVLMGGGAALGAAVGAIAGGGKGAAIGGVAGAGAGTAGAAATGKKEVAIAAETPMVFIVRGAVRL